MRESTVVRRCPGLHAGACLRAIECVAEGVNERCKVSIQSNNVEVDDRGYVYVVDRANSGMHILELTGGARRVMNFPAGTN